MTPSADRPKLANPIAKVPLQALIIPAGWTVSWHSFHAIDPDASLENLIALGLMDGDKTQEDGSDSDESDGTDSSIDLWQSTLSRFFKGSCLWRAHRNDYACEISLEWAPEGDPDGYYWLTEGRSRTITFAKKSKKRIRRAVENIELCYNLEPPVDWIPGFNRELKSRSRQEIVMTLNKWISDGTRYKSPRVQANQVQQGD